MASKNIKDIRYIDTKDTKERFGVVLTVDGIKYSLTGKTIFNAIMDIEFKHAYSDYLDFMRRDIKVNNYFFFTDENTYTIVSPLSFFRKPVALGLPPVIIDEKAIDDDTIYFDYESVLDNQYNYENNRINKIWFNASIIPDKDDENKKSIYIIPSVTPIPLATYRALVFDVDGSLQYGIDYLTHALLAMANDFTSSNNTRYCVLKTEGPVLI